MKPVAAAKTVADETGSALGRSRREDLVVQALKECQQTIDANAVIDRQAVLDKYAEVREELSACLRGLELLRVPMDDGTDITQTRNESPHAGRPLGDFRLLRELGRGGMGVVYEAEQRSVGRKVALKVLPYAAMLDQRQVARFQNEARAAATLEHPHIVPVYFVGSERGVHFYAMRLIDGKNLAEIHYELRRERSLSEGSRWDNTSAASAVDSLKFLETVRSECQPTHPSPLGRSGATDRARVRAIARIGYQIATALDFAHRHGIVHRDIKPANILLDASGDAWVTDFGLARIDSEGGVTMTGDMIGTLRYMPPEQAFAKRAIVDHRSDIYSLGVTLYELLTLEPLFHGDRATLLRRIATEQPRLPSSICWHVPRDLETVVLKAIQKNPQDRYETAQDFADDLERFLKHEPIQARRTPLAQRFRMWGARHPAMIVTLLAIGAVSLVSVAVIGVFYAKFERQARSRQQDATEEVTKALAEAQRNLNLADKQRERADSIADEATELRWQAESQAQVLREHLDVRDMQLAFQALANGWEDRAIDVLARQDPLNRKSEHRGFAWKLINELVWHPKPIKLSEHVGAVRTAVCFPDGRRIASVGDDGTIQVWDRETGEVQFKLSGTVEALGDLAAKFWDAVSLAPSPHSRSIRALAVSPDGKRLASGGMVLSLWDVEERTRIRDLSLFPTTIRGISFSPDGHLVAAQSADHGIQVCDTEGNKLMSDLTGAGISSLSFSPDGKWLVAPYLGGHVDRRRQGLRCWLVGDWEHPRDHRLDFVPRGCAFSPDSRFVLCGGQYGISAMVEIATGRIVMETSEQRAKSSDVAISSDSKNAAISYEDGTIGVIQLPKNWRSSPEPLIVDPRLYPVHSGPANGLEFLDGERLMTFGDDGAVCALDVDPSGVKRIFSRKELRNRCRYLSDSRFVVTTFDGFMVVDSVTQKITQKVRVIESGSHASGEHTTSLARSHDGAMIAVGTRDGKIGIHGAERGSPLGQLSQTDVRVSAITDIAFSPDGRWMANGSRDHTVRVRRSGDWGEVARYPTKGWGNNVRFSPDGRLLAFSDSDGSLGIIRTESWEVIARSDVVSGMHENSLRFSHDGRRLLTGHKDSSVRIWDVSSLALLGELKGHGKSLLGLSLHPDGKTLATVSGDQTVRLWYLPTRSQIGTLETFVGNASDCHFSPDGNKLVVNSKDNSHGVCHVWDLDWRRGRHRSTSEEMIGSHQPLGASPRFPETLR